jgi:hypothetical protein
VAVAAAVAVATAVVAVTEVGNALREPRGHGDNYRCVLPDHIPLLPCGQSTSIAIALFRWCASTGNIHPSACRRQARALIDCPTATCLATL